MEKNPFARSVLGSALNPSARMERTYGHAILVILIAAKWHATDEMIRRVAWGQIQRMTSVEAKVALANFLVVNRKPLAVARRLMKDMGI